MQRAFVLVVFLVSNLGTGAIAGPKEDVAAATQAWADAFNTRDPQRIVAMYDADAVLWGTISPIVRNTPELVWDYFKNSAKTPLSRVKLGEYHVRVYGDVALNTGYYTFTAVNDGQTISNPSRFSMAFRKRGDRWMIVDHHSSRIPLPPQ